MPKTITGDSLKKRINSVDIEILSFRQKPLVLYIIELKTSLIIFMTKTMKKFKMLNSKRIKENKNQEKKLGNELNR